MHKCNTKVSRYTILLLATVMATACAQDKKVSQYDQVSQDLSPDDQLILQIPIKLDADSQVVYFQMGHVVRKNEIGAKAPYCRLELNRAMPTLLPQEFVVANVTYDDRAQAKTDEQIYVTSIDFRGAESGTAKGMRCGWPGASGMTNFTTGDDIGATLGGYFSIKAQ